MEEERKILPEAKALYRAAAYCSKAERCEFDVRRKLNDWNAEWSAIEPIVKRLKDEKFLSDERYTESYINDKVRFNGWGRIKIEFELRRRNINESIYAPLLDQLPDGSFENKLMEILKLKVKSVKGDSDYERKGKLVRFAAGRGFPFDLAIKCVDKIMDKQNEDFS